MSNIWYIVILGLGVLYLLSPIDLVPDFIPILGWLEDILVLVAAIWFANRMRQSGRGGETADDAHHGEDAEALRGRSAESLAKTPWQLLEIEPDADDDEIEAAYKAQLMQYHPDRVAHLGHDLQDLAHEKTLEIQRAYEQIKRQRA